MPQGHARNHWRPVARFGVLWVGLILVDAVAILTFPWAKDAYARTNRFGFLSASGILLVIAGYGLQLKPIAHKLGLDHPAAESAGAWIWSLWDRASLTFLFLSEGLTIVALKRLILTYAKPNVLTDTIGYLQVAGISPAEFGFWAGQRPWTIPLFYRLLGATPSATMSTQVLDRIVLFQGALSIVAWLLLAGAVASTIRVRWLRPLLFGAIGVFGLSIHVSQWDTILLSESISTSMLIMGVAVGVLLLGRPAGAKLHRPWWVLLAAPILVLYSFARDANAYFLLVGAFILGLITMVRIVRRRTIPWLSVGLVAFAVVVFAGQQAAVKASGRSRGPFYGMFLQRVLLKPDRIPWFENAGMPLGSLWDGVDRSIGRVDFYRMVTSNPSASSFVRWMDEEGRRVYLGYWIAHPVEAAGLPLEDWSSLVIPDSMEYRGDGAVTPAWLRALTAVFFPLSGRGLLLLSAVTTLALAFAASLGWRSWWWLPIALLLTCLPMMFIVWHGDSIEIERHAFQIALQIRLAMWMLLVSAVGVFLTPLLTNSADPMLQPSSLTAE
jgi:hypothetical protein